MKGKHLIFILCYLLLSFDCFAQASEPGFKVVGYYSLNAAMSTVNKSALKRLTHVNLWFLNPDSTGNFPQDLSGLPSFIRAANAKM